MSLRVAIQGRSHLALTLRRAAEMRGFDTYCPMSTQDLTFIAEDVLDHSDVSAARVEFDSWINPPMLEYVPLILVSQVPPGTTRAWSKGRKNVFYQADTIIMKRALDCACHPEQIVVGCADPEQPLPLAYQEYLLAFDCLVLQMSYESAEMAKCAINYMLAKQIETANELSTACGNVGANYADVERALHNDARIGQHAYLRPGKTNQHLQRDVDAVKGLLWELGVLKGG